MNFESNIDPEVKEEFTHHQEKLFSNITDLRKYAERKAIEFRTETAQTMSENQELIREINVLRQTRNVAKISQKQTGNF